ncbi:MAG TPA: GntR family transcriptional regulator [Candidatus Limnocylindria bacterium]|nr:GntR family transcriptional regulator [Candidatus Limnocylindria bacterium]
MTSARPPTVARRTLAGQVYDLLLQQVLDGSLRPGERLVEAEIATSVGTSRGPVREAIARLQRQGLVRSDPFVGASIVESDQRELEEIYSLRAVLEGYAASLVAQRCTRDDIMRLRAITERMRDAHGDRLASQLRALDGEFHSTLVRLADDRQLLQAWERGRTRVALYLSTVEEAFHDAEAMARMHERFIDALLTGDPVEAEKRVRAHLMANGQEWTTKMRWPEPAGSPRRNDDGRGDGVTVTDR